MILIHCFSCKRNYDRLFLILMDKFKAINVNNILTDKLKLNYISTTIFFFLKKIQFFI